MGQDLAVTESHYANEICVYAFADGEAKRIYPLGIRQEPVYLNLNCLTKLTDQQVMLLVSRMKLEWQHSAISLRYLFTA